MEPTGIFEKGDRGPICRRPSDRGAWVVPDRHSAVPELEVPYVFEVTGAPASGRIRFARILEKLADRDERLAKKFLPLIEGALERPEKLRGFTGPRYSGVKFEVGGESFVLYLTGKKGGGFARDWLQGPNWLPLLSLTEAALAAIKAARKTLKAAEEEESTRIAKIVAETNAANEVRRIERVAEDAPFVSAFFAVYPEAAGWFTQPRADLTRRDIEDESIRRGLAKPIATTRTGEWPPWPPMQGDEQVYLLLVGGKEITISVHYCGGDDD